MNLSLRKGKSHEAHRKHLTAQVPKKTQREESDLVILGGGTDSTVRYQMIAQVIFLPRTLREDRPRQFRPLFREQMGRSPAKAIERLRVESARLMMESGRFSTEEIARKNGFGNRERMRRSFVRAFGQSPQAIQRTASALMP